MVESNEPSVEIDSPSTSARFTTAAAAAFLACFAVALFGVTRAAPYGALGTAIAVGLTASVATPKARLAVGLSASAMLVAVVAAHLMSTVPFPPSWWIAVGAVVVAGGTALLARRIASASTSGRRKAAVIAVAIIIATTWYGGVHEASRPAGATDLSFEENLDYKPIMGPDTPDALLYYLYVQNLAAGNGYYEQAVFVLSEVNRIRGGGWVNQTSPISYRTPILYWLLAALPRDGWSYVAATLMLASVVTAAAYLLGRAFAPPHIAIAVSAAVSVPYIATAASPGLFNAELWAGGLALSAIALFATAMRGRDRKADRTMWAAAAVALLAAVVRETAVAFLLVGLAASLIDRHARSLRWWMPWIAGLGVWVGAMALHWRAALAAIERSGLPRMHMPQVWFHPDALGFPAAIDRLSQTTGLLPTFVVALLILAAMAAWRVGSGPGDRLMLAAPVIAGIIVVTFFYPPGSQTQSDLPPSYWVELISPTVLACGALALALLRAPSASQRKRAPYSPPSSEDSTSHSPRMDAGTYTQYGSSAR